MQNVDKMSQTARARTEDARENVRGAADDIASTAKQTYDKVSANVMDAAGDLREVAGRTVSQLRDSSADVYDAAQGFSAVMSKSLQQSIRQQPFTALGIALAAGFVVGSIMRR